MCFKKLKQSYTAHMKNKNHKVFNQVIKSSEGLRFNGLKWPSAKQHYKHLTLGYAHRDLNNKLKQENSQQGYGFGNPIL